MTGPEAQTDLSSSVAVEHIASSYEGSVAFVVGLGRTAGLVERIEHNPVLALDAMGSVLPVATGLAIGLAGSGSRVVAFDSDGSVLLELGALAGLAACESRVDSLDVFVVDNGLYESGGGGQSRYFPLDWRQLFGAFGLHVAIVSTENELVAHLSSSRADSGRVRCAVLQVRNECGPGSPATPFDGRDKVVRFMDRLLQDTGRTRWRRATKL